MKKYLCLAILILFQISAKAADLLEVYQQAQISDPQFQEEIAKNAAIKEGVPISVAGLLPNISGSIAPSLTRTGYSGSFYQPTASSVPGYLSPRNISQRGYIMNLTINQTIFDFTKYSTIAEHVALSKGADAALNAALQELMIRVATAYFAVLQDEDNLHYNEASKRAYQEQLDQIDKQFQAGLKTNIDVALARASYETAIAKVINTQTILENDKEKLREITGIYYPQLAPLSDHFPLVSPTPNNEESWVNTALTQNWSIKASQYDVNAALQVVRERFAGHLPTLGIIGTLNKTYADNINNYNSFNERNGPGTQYNREVALNLTIPIFSGGEVSASTQKAKDDYELAQQRLEQRVRETLSTTRQSYLNIIAGIRQVAADLQSVKSNQISLAGFKERYHAGAETLFDVLNQQQTVLEAQMTYAQDRYAYIKNLFLLKQAAGTLSFDDLRTINHWLR